MPEQDVERPRWSPQPRIVPTFAIPKPYYRSFRLYAFILFFLYILSAIFYFYVRFAFTVGKGAYPKYEYAVLGVELFGVSAFLPYCFLLVRVTLSKKTPGLAAATEPPTEEVYSAPWFHVRVLIPCYKESQEVIRNTVMAAVDAHLPPNCLKTVYLCDDGKSAEKEEFIRGLNSQHVVYVSGRKRKNGEMNGKSANLNNCLQNVIYAHLRDEKGRVTNKVAKEHIPPCEVITVFDADMVCKPHFFLKVLEVMADDSVALCLTPQAFSNIRVGADLFNNINLQFWEYILPGSDPLGYVACTGTNFCIRALALGHAGWFPEYTITEDYALGMELAKRKYRGVYLGEYLAIGEAPDSVRNVMRQRSRWTKGHMQVFFSWRCPLFNWRLSWANKWLYTNGTWAYFATIATTPTFVLVPFLALIFGIYPLTITRQFALAATVYFSITFLIQSYCRKLSHAKSLWFAVVSNHVLSFTYFKAVFNVIFSVFGCKARVVFKATDKQGGPATHGAAAAPRFNPPSHLHIPPRGASPGPLASPRASPHSPTPHGARPPSRPTGLARSLPAPSTGPSPTRVPMNPYPHSASINGPAGQPASPTMNYRGASRTALAQGPHAPQHGPHTPAFGAPDPHVMSRANPLSPYQKMKEKEAASGCSCCGCCKRTWCCTFCCCQCLCPNVGDLQGTIDANVLLIDLLLSLIAIGGGVYRQYSTGRVDPYTMMPIFWAGFNAIPPYLFLHYLFSKGKSFERVAAFLRFLGMALGAIAIACLWLTTRKQFNEREALWKTVAFLDASKSGLLPPSTTQTFPWRGGAGKFDGNDISRDLSGGWYTNPGSTVKFGLPTAVSAAYMAWGFIEFKGGYVKAQQDAAFLGNLRWGTDYLLRAHIDNGSFVAQIGNPYLERKYWMRPEDMDDLLDVPRKSYVLNATTGGSDIFATSAAALAAASVAFRDSDRAYADNLLLHATQLYGLAMATKNTSYCRDYWTGIECWRREVVTATCNQPIPANMPLPEPLATYFNHPVLQSPSPPAPTPAAAKAPVATPTTPATVTPAATTPPATPRTTATITTPPATAPTTPAAATPPGRRLVQTWDTVGGAPPAAATPTAGTPAAATPAAATPTADTPAAAAPAAATPTAATPAAPTAAAATPPAATPLAGTPEVTTPATPTTTTRATAPAPTATSGPVPDQVTAADPTAAPPTTTPTTPPTTPTTTAPTTPIAAPTTPTTTAPTAATKPTTTTTPPTTTPTAPTAPITTPTTTPIPVPDSALPQDNNPTVVSTTPSPASAGTTSTTTTVNNLQCDVTVTDNLLYTNPHQYDDLAWAAAWMYKATGKEQYHQEASDMLGIHLNYEAALSDTNYYLPDVHNLAWATHILLDSIKPDPYTTSYAKQFVRTWVRGTVPGFKTADGKPLKAVFPTPGGLAWSWNNSLPHAATASLLSLIHAKHQQAATATALQCWARDQIHYMLGSNGRSFLVGYGRKYPRRVPARGASCAIGRRCSWDSDYYTSDPNPNLLLGALVAGPTAKDKYKDQRDYDGARVGVENNMGFMGALAGLVELQLSNSKCDRNRGVYQYVYQEQDLRTHLKKRVQNKLSKWFSSLF